VAELLILLAEYGQLASPCHMNKKQPFPTFVE
jgi:hypothetical protein